MNSLSLDWIELEFFSGYQYCYYKLRYESDGRIIYTGEGDLSSPLHGVHEWVTSSRIYNNLARKLLARPWESEIDQAEEGFMVCDGWNETLRWSIEGETHEFTVQVGMGPDSILKIIKRINKLLKEEEKKHSF